MADGEDEEAAGHGSPGYEGYLYQIDVSIWAALEFVLVKRQARQVVLEPAGYDDVEAPLADDEIGPVATGARVVGTQLVIQAKLRNTGPWGLNDLKRLLKHGKRRESVAARLKRDAGSAYLLVTSADLVGRARETAINTLRASKWPAGLPKTIKDVIPTGDGRFAVLATQDPDKLASNLQRLLEESFRVPRSRIEACLIALRAEATDRLRGGAGGVWTREQLVAILRAHGGRLARSAERETFVPPTNWAEIRSRMAENHAVILAGSSGTGKSTGAKVLAEELADETPGLTPVLVERGPDQVRFDQTAEPVIFLIDAPWGHYRFSPGARPWNDELGRLLETASANRRFIVTTRSDVMAESGAKRLAAKWYVNLEVENYGALQRQRLFENRLPQLREELVLVADRHRRRVLDDLASPLEIQKFFDALGEGPQEENEHAFVQRCIASAHESAIEDTVVQQVQAREALPAAAIVWGVLKARPKVSTEILDALEADLGARFRELEDAISPLVSVLVAARHLRQDDVWLSYYHNRIEKALETAIKAKPAQTGRLLGGLVDAFLALGDESGADDWGRESAALLINAVADDSPLRARVSPAAQARLDAWLEAGLQSSEPEFRRRLRMAAAVGRSSLCQVARWLVHRTRPGHDLFLEHWSPDPDDEAWYDARRAEPLTAMVCARFIRDVLPDERDDHRREFVERVQRLAGDLTAAFLDAAHAIVGYGVNWNSEMIAEGALQDLDGFEAVAESAIAVWEATYDPAIELAALNGEYSDDALERIWEDRAEDGHTAGELLDAYVLKLRDTRGWQAVAASRLVDGLVPHWIAVLTKGEEAPSADEVLALASAANQAGRAARFWWFASSHWHDELWPQLQAVLDGPLADHDLLAAAASTASRHQPAELLARFQHWAGTDPLRLAAVVEALFHPKSWDTEPGDDERAFLQGAAAQLGPVIGPTLVAVARHDKDPPALTAESRTWLEALDVSVYPRLGLPRARLISSAGGDPAPHLPALLSQVTDSDKQDMRAAVWAAAQVASSGDAAQLQLLLAHRFADVRKIALETLGAKEVGALPPALLALAEDKGNRVRRALVELLASHPSPTHTGTLLQLIGDSWQPQSRYYGEEAHYPIAQRAAEVLAEGLDVPLDALDGLVARARETEDAGLRTKVLAVLARVCGRDGRGRLVDLVRDRTNYPLGAAAAGALLDTEVTVESDLLAAMDGRELLSRHATVAVEAGLLFGAKAGLAHLLAVAQAVSGHASRRALLVALAAAALERTDGAAEAMTALLPAKLQAGLKPACYDGPPLARADLPDGDPRIADQLVRRLAFLFTPRPATAGPAETAETAVGDISAK